MQTFVGYVGWTIVAAAVGAYVWVLFRVVLFPKIPAIDEVKQETRRAA
jgi:hypothetical protein